LEPVHRISLIAGITSLVGPTCTALYEKGHYSFIESDPLLEIWVMAAIAAFGVGIGVFSICRGAKVAGVICFLTNAPVFALYGFIAYFFTSGGTR
jgi:hypothetical protein